MKHLRQLYLNNNNITTLPASIGNLKHLEGLYLSYNKIATLPASIANLAVTCTNFHIDGNPLSKPLEEAANRVFQGMKQYVVESKTFLEEAARLANIYYNYDNSESPRLHEEELTLTRHTGEVNEATATTDIGEPFVHTPPVENNPTFNSTTNINDDAVEVFLAVSIIIFLLRVSGSGLDKKIRTLLMLPLLLLPLGSR